MREARLNREFKDAIQSGGGKKSAGKRTQGVMSACGRRKTDQGTGLTTTGDGVAAFKALRLVSTARQFAGSIFVSIGSERSE